MTNDNKEAAKGEAVLCLAQWLDDNLAHEPEVVVSACDVLGLSEGDIEYLCRHCRPSIAAVIPISHFIDF